jgi:ABC-type transport system involved in cytochrome c biogenesis permease subunit
MLTAFSAAVCVVVRLIMMHELYALNFATCRKHPVLKIVWSRFARRTHLRWIVTSAPPRIPCISDVVLVGSMTNFLTVVFIFIQKQFFQSYFVRIVAVCGHRRMAGNLQSGRYRPCTQKLSSE